MIILSIITAIINTKYGKNLIGSFYQPALVISDTNFLKSLPKREILCGYGEIFKHSIIFDKKFFLFLDKNFKNILKFKSPYIEKTIYGYEKQKLSSQTLSLNIRFRQKWGNISSYLNATQFLNDGSKKRFSLRSDLDIRIFEGLAVRLSGNINLIREQYSLAAGNTSIEDLLLQQRQIATDYRTGFSLGLSYTFGSIYNSIINTRL